MLRLCGQGILAVYMGDRVDALTHVATRHSSEGGCGRSAAPPQPAPGQWGASLVVSAIKGEVYRIAFASFESPGELAAFQLMIGTQAAVVTDDGTPLFSYWAFPGQTDRLKLRLAGAGRERALLLEAQGVTAANGCQAEPTPGLLRCPVPGRAAPVLDIDLGDGSDTADIRLLGPVRPPGEPTPLSEVLGGAGNDTLSGSAGSHSWFSGWSGGLRLFGGGGADRLRGDRGFD